MHGGCAIQTIGTSGGRSLLLAGVVVALAATTGAAWLHEVWPRSVVQTVDVRAEKPQPPALTVTTPGEGGGSAAAVTLILSMLRPAVSNSSVICCWPAASVTGTFTVVQFCQPPVAGIETCADT